MASNRVSQETPELFELALEHAELNYQTSKRRDAATPLTIFTLAGSVTSWAVLVRGRRLQTYKYHNSQVTTCWIELDKIVRMATPT